MIAITTKYHGPTNTLGSRLSCRSAGRPWRIFVNWDSDATDLEKHTRALAAYCHKYFRKHAAETDRWHAYHFGHTNEGMVFVKLHDFDGDHARDTVWINNATGAYALEEPGE